LPWIIGGVVAATVVLGLLGLLVGFLVLKPGALSKQAKEGYATPDEVLDAYVKAIRDGDKEAFMKINTRNKVVKNEIVMGDYSLLLKVRAEQEWKEGIYKRFPAEINGDKAIIVRLLDNGTSVTGTNFIFNKVGDLWYLTDETGGYENEFDPKKYPWEKRRRKS
jgi:hypothetical protein